MNKYLFIQNLIIILIAIFIGIVAYMQYVMDKLIKENEELKRGVGND